MKRTIQITVKYMALVLCLFLMFLIMAKVEQKNSYNTEMVRMTNEKIRHGEECLDSIKREQALEQKKLDSLRQLTESQKTQLEYVRKQKAFLQQLPSKEDIKKIKFNR